MAEPHRQAVIDIYSYLVDHGFAAYRERRLPYEACDRFLEMTTGYPALVVVEADGRVTGFAFLHAWHPAECFTRTAEITYFLHPDPTRRGLGTRLRHPGPRLRRMTGRPPPRHGETAHYCVIYAGVNKSQFDQERIEYAVRYSNGPVASGLCNAIII